MLVTYKEEKYYSLFSFPFKEKLRGM